jgi:hypothetical protein
MSYFNKICEFVHNHFFLSAYNVIEEICRQIYVFAKYIYIYIYIYIYVCVYILSFIFPG